jgi:hypothetical protein
MPKPSSKWTESYLNRKKILGIFNNNQNHHNNLNDKDKKFHLPSKSLQPTIKDYLPTIMCLLCGNDLEITSLSKQYNYTNNKLSSSTSSTTNLNLGYLCSTCSLSPSNAINSLYSRMNYLDKTEKNHRIICRSCCNFPQIEELFIHDLPNCLNENHHSKNIFIGQNCCISNDCPIFFERYRSISKRENIQLSILALTNCDFDN